MHKLLTAPTGKAVAGAVVGLLAAGSAGAVTYSLASSEDTTEAELLETQETEVTKDATTAPVDAKAGKHTAEATTDEVPVAEDDAETTKPVPFGAIVSEDAREGGVDGQEISELAHANNEARKAARDADADADADDTKDDDADEVEDDSDDADEDEDDDEGRGRSADKAQGGKR